MRGKRRVALWSYFRTLGEQLEESLLTYLQTENDCFTISGTMESRNWSSRTWQWFNKDGKRDEAAASDVNSSRWRQHPPHLPGRAVMKKRDLWGGGIRHTAVSSVLTAQLFRCGRYQLHTQGISSSPFPLRVIWIYGSCRPVVLKFFVLVAHLWVSFTSVAPPLIFFNYKK
jgi:hypothetical protein